MSIRPNGAVLRQIQILFDLGSIGELTDGQLLERFTTSGGESAELAFAALVDRHGPMVLRVCRGACATPTMFRTPFRRRFSSWSARPARSGCETHWAPGSIAWPTASPPGP